MLTKIVVFIFKHLNINQKTILFLNFCTQYFSYNANIEFRVFLCKFQFSYLLSILSSFVKLTPETAQTFMLHTTVLYQFDNLLI